MATVVSLICLGPLFQKMTHNFCENTKFAICEKLIPNNLLSSPHWAYNRKSCILNGDRLSCQPRECPLSEAKYKQHAGHLLQLKSVKSVVKWKHTDCPSAFTVSLAINGWPLQKMKKVNKQCLLDTPRTVRVSEKSWQVIVQTRRP